ncbi:PIN domain-containing protein [Thiocapsa bogorovii]|uniref:PIN domain-containing protein n=1 Tax=Thiocapsa bogorovii TaxID=521689 RepID=UPI001E2A894C|nr:PIN domain-containing protein [Thiocapsa bogorovii]UHD15903.1 PIN domain-containing protein [Thiocapsa bogorovii]
MTTETDFFDTNVVLYLLSEDEIKANRAEALLAAGGTISVQVLNEFVSVARRKLGCDWAEVRDILETIRALCPVQPLTIEVHDLGLRLAERYGLAIYDAMIAASALDCGCTTLWSEDFQDGQILDGRLRVRNPFVTSPGRA